MVASEKQDWPRNRPSPASAHTIFLQRLAGRKPWKVPPSGNHRRGSTNCKNDGDDVKRLSSSYCFEQRLTRLLGDLSDLRLPRLSDYPGFTALYSPEA